MNTFAFIRAAGSRMNDSVDFEIIGFTTADSMESAASSLDLLLSKDEMNGWRRIETPLANDQSLWLATGPSLAGENILKLLAAPMKKFLSISTDCEL